MLLGSDDVMLLGCAVDASDGSEVGSEVIMLLGSGVAVTHAATSLAPASVVVAEVVVVVQSRVTVADESYALLNFSLWAIQPSTMYMP